MKSRDIAWWISNTAEIPCSLWSTMHAHIFFLVHDLGNLHPVSYLWQTVWLFACVCCCHLIHALLCAWKDQQRLWHCGNYACPLFLDVLSSVLSTPTLIPNSNEPTGPCSMWTPHPPGPGLPVQEPSVHATICCKVVASAVGGCEWLHLHLSISPTYTHEHTLIHIHAHTRTHLQEGRQHQQGATAATITNRSNE